MLHVFQRTIKHSYIHTWNTKTLIDDICNRNVLCSLNKVFYKSILSTHSYLVCFRTAKDATQPAITCSKLTIETLEQGVKYVQS